MLAEEELIRKVKEGDMHAFEQLFELYKTSAKRLAYMITGSIADSEDVVQETFIQCYGKISQLKELSLFQSWFYRILTRIAWKYCNHRNKVQPVDEFSESDIMEYTPLNSASDQVLKNEEAKILYEAICNLDKKQRTVIILYYYNDLSLKEISLIMRCSEGTVKSRLYTARKNLKLALKSRDYMEVEMFNNGRIKAI